MCQPDTAFLGQVSLILESVIPTPNLEMDRRENDKKGYINFQPLKVWWDKKAPKAFIDFDNEHKCKNFEAIRQWAEDHQLPYLLEDNVPGDFLEAPDIDLVYFEIP